MIRGISNQAYTGKSQLMKQQNTSFGAVNISAETAALFEKMAQKDSGKSLEVLTDIKTVLDKFNKTLTEALTHKDNPYGLSERAKSLLARDQEVFVRQKGTDFTVGLIERSSTNVERGISEKEVAAKDIVDKIKSQLISFFGII